MSYTPVHTRKAAKHSLLMLLLLSLVSLFAVGCNDDEDEFVIIGTGNAGTSGNVLFSIPPGLFPAETEALFFDFFNSATPSQQSFLVTAESAYNAGVGQVTVQQVPGQAQTVIITAFDTDGHPIADTLGTVVTHAGGQRVVNLNGATVTPITFNSINVTPDPVNLVRGTQAGATEQLTVQGLFSNSEIIMFNSTGFPQSAVFTSRNPAIATVSNTGLVTGLTNGQTFIDVTYTVDGVTRTVDNVEVNVTGGVTPPADAINVTPTTLTLPQGSTSGNLTVFRSEQGGEFQDITGSQQVTFASNNADFVVNPNTGAVTVGAGATNGETATITATYTDADGSVTDTVVVTAGPTTATSAVFFQPGGNTLRLLDGMIYELNLEETVSDNTTRVLGNGNFAAYDFNSTNDAVATVDEATGFLTAVAPGTATIQVLNTGTQTVVDSFTLTVLGPAVTIQNINLIPTNNFVLTVGETEFFAVQAEYSDGTFENITNVSGVTFTETGAGTSVVAFGDGSVTGQTAGTATTFNVTVPGFAAANPTVINVDVN